MPPPPLLSTTMTSGCGSARRWISAVRSCSSERSPIIRVAGRPRPQAKPAAVETIPSMPLAPRFAATARARAARSSANISMSRIGMLLARNRPWPAGISRETMRAAAISPKGADATKASMHAPARAESSRSRSPQAPAGAAARGSTPRREQLAEAARSSACTRMRDAVLGVVAEGVVLHRDHHGVRQRGQRLARGAWRPAGRRGGARRPGRRTRAPAG